MPQSDGVAVQSKSHTLQLDIDSILIFAYQVPIDDTAGWAASPDDTMPRGLLGRLVKFLVQRNNRLNQESNLGLSITRLMPQSLGHTASLTHIHTHTHTNSQAHTRALTHKHTRTHAHTHTHLDQLLLLEQIQLCRLHSIIQSTLSTP